MECNKDEAVRAKGIAEKKIAVRDYAGAKKLVLRAQNLYPELDGVSQMLAMLDVYIASQNRIPSGEVDWYRVLGVNPWADEDAIKKAYRKLVLMLHPDKNRSLGADGAFNLISEAWNYLSDKDKRLAYNQKLNVIGVQQRTSTATNVPSASPRTNGYLKRTTPAYTKAQIRGQNNNSCAGPSSVPTGSYQPPSTFWTMCNGCKTQFEYLRVYVNHTLLCPNCNEAFLALERAPPPSVMKPPRFASRQRHQHARHHVATSNHVAVAQSSGSMGSFSSSNGPSIQRNHYTGMPTAGSVASSFFGDDQSPSVVQHTQQPPKRKHEESGATSEWERNLAFRKTGHGSISSGSTSEPRIREWERNHASKKTGQGGVAGGNAAEPRRGNYDTERFYGHANTNNKPKTEKELSLGEVRNMLMAKAKLSIQKRLGEMASDKVKLEDIKRRKSMETNQTKQRSLENNHATIDKKNVASGVMYKGKQHKSVSGIASDGFGKEALAPVSINVPDPDFHNFDLDRTENCFEDDQVWAAYDDEDGMPRFYARIQKVLSLKPFKMKISWLNSRSTSEFGSLDWVGYGFPKTCGDFRTGKHEISETLNSFSHRVNWTKGPRGVIRILPRKGEIWALYRNWSSEWNEHTPDDVIHEYDMAEVVDDYTEEGGISVIPLVKVPGFKTVFQRHSDANKVKRIPKVEMFRFSHQVPDHLLTGEEAHNAPKGCWELDPAATPLELLEVITGASEAQTAEFRGHTEEMVQKFPERKVDGTVENALITDDGDNQI